MTEKKDNNPAWRRRFYAVALSQGLSLITSAAIQFMMIWQLSADTGSAKVLSLSGLAAFLPMVLLSPIAGIAADRYNKKIITIAADIAVGLVTMGYALLSAFWDPSIYMILVVLFARAVGNTFQQPAISALIPSLVPKENLMQAGGILQTVRSASYILGPMIGGSLYAFLPIEYVLPFDLVIAIIAGIILWQVKIPEKKSETKAKSFVLSEIKEGFNVFLSNKLLLGYVICVFLCNLLYTPLDTFFPLMTGTYFKLPAFYGSVSQSIMSAGVIISAAVFSTGFDVKHKLRLSAAGYLGMGIVCFLSGAMPATFAGWIGFTICSLCIGLFGNVYALPFNAYIQETVPEDKLGRAFSTLMAINSVTIPLGLAFGGPLADMMGINSWFIVSGIGIAVVAVVTLSLLFRFPES